jgi:hypothetical protein
VVCAAIAAGATTTTGAANKTAINLFMLFLFLVYPAHHAAG